MRNSIHTSERGATLLVALIMLLLITVLVSGSFSLSTVNLKAVGNMQVRQEAIASANAALDQVVSTNFTADPAAAASDLTFDINNDGSDDYTVAIAVPECIRATQSVLVPNSSQQLKNMPSSLWNTVWMIQATVNDAVTGAQTIVRSAVRVLLKDADKKLVCP